MKLSGALQTPIICNDDKIAIIHIWRSVTLNNQTYSASGVLTPRKTRNFIRDLNQL